MPAQASVQAPVDASVDAEPTVAGEPPVSAESSNADVAYTTSSTDPFSATQPLAGSGVPPSGTYSGFSAAYPGPAASGFAGAPSDPSVPPTGTAWPQTHAWIEETKRRRAENRRRSAPVRWTAWAAIAVALSVLILADSVGGIVIPAYFWTIGGIAVIALVVGAAMRRTPYSMIVLVVPSIIALLALGNTGASLHDGVGSRDWSPSSAGALSGDYRLAAGRGTLDLTALDGKLTGDAHVKVTMAAGQLRIVAPASMNLTVNAHVRAGAVTVDGQAENIDTTNRSRGFNVDTTINPLDTATGPSVTVDADVADGNVDVRYR